MKYYDDTISSGISFEGKIGKPGKFYAALGHIVESFSFLDETLSNVIILLLDIENNLGYILTAELSYKTKINIFGSLIKLNIEKYKKSSHEDIEAQFKELLSLCNKAEELRNQIMHSSYVADRYRIKTTAKAKKGLKKTIEGVNPDNLLDIADFIARVGLHVEEFPMVLGIADRFSVGPDGITYLKKDKILKTFKHTIRNV